MLTEGALIVLPVLNMISSSLLISFCSAVRKRSGLKASGSSQWSLLCSTRQIFGMMAVPFGMVYPRSVVSFAAM